MARDANGVYTLPNSPVVTQNVIASAHYNSTLSDFATEIQDSLSRSGKGAMTAALQSTAGSAASPGIHFGTTTDGIYGGDGFVGVTLNGSRVAVFDEINPYLAFRCYEPVHITNPADTTRDVLAIDSSSITNGRLLEATSTSAATNSRAIVKFHNNNASATAADVLELVQEATANSLFIDHNANSIAVDINSDSTTQHVIDIAASTLTTGYAITSTSTNGLNLVCNGTTTTINYLQDESLTSGSLLKLSGGSSTFTGNLLEIADTDVSGHGHMLHIECSQNDGAGVYAVYSSNTANGNMHVGYFAYTGSGTTAKSVVDIVNDNIAASNTACLSLVQDATGHTNEPFIKFTGTDAASVTAPVSSHGTAGSISKWLQVDVNGTKLWLPAYTNPSA